MVSRKGNIRLLVPKEKEKHEKNGIKHGQRKRLSSYQFQTFIEPAHGESAGTLISRKELNDRT